MHYCYGLINFTEVGKYFSPFEKQCLIFSGLVHDIGHPGRTNLFECNLLTQNALRYNDLHVQLYFNIIF